MSLTFLRHRKTVLNAICRGKSLCFTQNLGCLISFKQSPFTKTVGSTFLTAQKIPKISNPLFRCLVRRSGTGTEIKPKEIVGYWFLGCSGMVIIAVVLGGVTRLTESGLSMVTWRLLGEKMPFTQNDWLLEFAKYQEYPEYKLLKRNITLDEFKWIWYMEYAHRTWGRLIGVAFYVPAVFFWIKGYLPRVYKIRVAAFGTLIAMQGLMGWYMVKSGLEDRFHKETDIPRVSQYRLAAHLGLALLLYTGTLYAALDILLPLPKTAITFNMTNLKRIAHFSTGLIFLTAISGALVAGMDAGLLYNSFPKMGERWIPEEILSLSPKIKNFTENPVTVQFDHRILGTATMIIIYVLWFLSQRTPLPPRTKNAVNALACMGALQVFLGISTLLNFVPTSVATVHQSGSIALISCATWLTHELKYLKYIPK